MILIKLQDIVYNNPGRRDKFILSNFFLSLFFNLVLWLALLFGFWQMSELAVLRYNIYFGVSSLGPAYLVYFLPLLGLVIGLINFLLSLNFYLKYRILSYYLAVAVTLFHLAALVVGGLLIYINL